MFIIKIIPSSKYYENCYRAWSFLLINRRNSDFFFFFFFVFIKCLDLLKQFTSTHVWSLQPNLFLQAPMEEDKYHYLMSYLICFFLTCAAMLELSHGYFIYMHPFVINPLVKTGFFSLYNYGKYKANTSVLL